MKCSVDCVLVQEHFLSSSLTSYTHDQIIINFIASQSDDRESLYCKETRIDGFLDYRNMKGSAQ